MNVPAGPERRPTRSESMFLTKEENCAPENWCLCQKEKIVYGRTVKCNRASTDWVKDMLWMKSGVELGKRLPLPELREQMFVLT